MDGTDYKATREAKGINLRDIFEETRVSISNLEAIENGNFSVLPSPFISRSFIKTYAQALGCDAHDLLQRYEEYLKEQGKQEASKEAADFVHRRDDVKAAVSKLVQRAADLLRQKKAVLFRLGLSLLLLIAAVLAVKMIYPLLSESVEGERPPAVSANDYTVVISATEPVWARVIVDGAVTEDFSLVSGDSIERKAKKSIVVESGNAGGMRIVFQGQDIGVLGRRGEIVRIVLPSPTAMPATGTSDSSVINGSAKMDEAAMPKPKRAVTRETEKSARIGDTSRESSVSPSERVKKAQEP